MIRKTLRERQKGYHDLYGLSFTNDTLRFISILPRVIQLKSDNLKRKPQVI